MRRAPAPRHRSRRGRRSRRRSLGIAYSEHSSSALSICSGGIPGRPTSEHAALRSARMSTSIASAHRLTLRRGCASRIASSKLNAAKVLACRSTRPRIATPPCVGEMTTSTPRMHAGGDHRPRRRDFLADCQLLELPAKVETTFQTGQTNPMRRRTQART